MPALHVRGVARLVKAAWLAGRPVLVLAVGADSPGKQELDPQICGSADLVVVDSRAQCVVRGEIQHAVSVGLLDSTTVRDSSGERRQQRRGTVVR
jgi:ornithine cyclodeaminase/alanine dehydrogenase-like protein (mu-crystallin family)